MKLKEEISATVSSENASALKKEYDRKITVPNQPAYAFFKRTLDIKLIFKTAGAVFGQEGESSKA